MDMAAAKISHESEYVLMLFLGWIITTISCDLDGDEFYLISTCTSFLEKLLPF